jgi:ADP-glucose pyrophosphorylase
MTTETPIKELNEIENEAYLAEASFWEEIDNIYSYFDQEMEMLKNEDSSTFTAFD